MAFAEAGAIPPACLIDAEGLLKPAVQGLLAAAFGFDRRSLARTRWRPLSPTKVLSRWLDHRGFAAITLGRHVYYVPRRVASCSLTDWLVLVVHEQTHRQQQVRHGMLGFYLRYGLNHLRYGYRANPFEVEAYGWPVRQLAGWRGPSGLRVIDLLADEAFEAGVRQALLLHLGRTWRAGRAPQPAA
jgi:hypothetical protein